MQEREHPGKDVGRVTSPYGVTTPGSDGDDDDGGQQYKGWKDRYTAYYGSDWQDVRERVLERDDYQCRSCGLTDEQHKKDDGLFGAGLHVHHKTPSKVFDTYDAANDLSNLVALCADCHRDAENGTLDL